jgi:hypothetical protein
MEPPFGRVDDLGKYADQFASEQHVDCSDLLAIHLRFNSFQAQFDAITTDQSSTTIHFHHKSRTVSHGYGRNRLPVIFMVDSPPAEPDTPGDAYSMARTYSTEELLNLRDTLPFVICDMNKLSPDFTSSIRTPRSCAAITV